MATAYDDAHWNAQNPQLRSKLGVALVKMARTKLAESGVDKRMAQALLRNPDSFVADLALAVTLDGVTAGSTDAAIDSAIAANLALLRAKTGVDRERERRGPEPGAE